MVSEVRCSHHITPYSSCQHLGRGESPRIRAEDFGSHCTMTDARRRVLHLIESWGPGGAETVFAQLASRTDSDRWDSFASVPESGWVSQALESAGVKPFLIPAKGRLNVRYLRKLVRLIRRLQIDLIHAHLFGATLYGGMAGRVCGIPVVGTLHGEPDLPESSLLTQVKYAVLRRTISKMVLVSKALSGSFHARGSFPTERSQVIYNGIEIERFAHAAASVDSEIFRTHPDDILVGAVGNFRPAKALDVFVRAAAILLREDSRYRFLVAGEKDEMIFPVVRALADQLGLRDRIVFLGFHPRVEEVFAALDVYVSSSTREGFSLTTVQAMAAGVPVVATRSGGPEEIVEDEETGLLVDVGSPEQIATAVERLTRDGPFAEKVTSAARSAAGERFSLTRMTDEYEALYTELLT